MTRYELRQVARVVYDVGVSLAELSTALYLAQECRATGDEMDAVGYMARATELLESMRATRDALRR